MWKDAALVEEGDLRLSLRFKPKEPSGCLSAISSKHGPCYLKRTILLSLCPDDANVTHISFQRLGDKLGLSLRSSID